MNKILSLILSVSVLANIAFLIVIYRIKNYDVSPRFHPFDINIHVTPESLRNNGYEVIPEDVPLLGKSIGDTLIYYQIAVDYNDVEIDQLVELEIHDGDTVYIEPPSIEKDEPNYIVFCRNCQIQLPEIDSSKIVEIINKYDGIIISDWNMVKPSFFVKYMKNLMIFDCSVYTNYEKKNILNISCFYPKLND